MQISPANLNTPLSTNSSKNTSLRLRQEFLEPPDGERKQLKKAAQEFEGIFVQQLMDAMDKTVNRDNSMFGNSQAESMFRGMMNQHMAKAATSGPAGSGFGLAETIYQQMASKLETQDARDNAGTESVSGAVNRIKALMTHDAATAASSTPSLGGGSTP